MTENTAVLRIFSLIISVITALIFIALPSVGGVVDSDTYHTGPLIVSGNETLIIRECTFEQEGNVIVKDRGNLILDDATFIMKMDSADQYGVSVKDRACVVVTNASVLRGNRTFTITLFSRASIHILSEGEVQGCVVQALESSDILVRHAIIANATCSGTSTLRMYRARSEGVLRFEGHSSGYIDHCNVNGVGQGTFGRSVDCLEYSRVLINFTTVRGDADCIVGASDNASLEFKNSSSNVQGVFAEDKSTVYIDNSTLGNPSSVATWYSYLRGAPRVTYRNSEVHNIYLIYQGSARIWCIGSDIYFPGSESSVSTSARYLRAVDCSPHVAISDLDYLTLQECTAILGYTGTTSSIGHLHNHEDGSMLIYEGAVVEEVDMCLSVSVTDGFSRPLRGARIVLKDSLTNQTVAVYDPQSDRTSEMRITGCDGTSYYEFIRRSRSVYLETTYREITQTSPDLIMMSCRSYTEVFDYPDLTIGNYGIWVDGDPAVDEEVYIWADILNNGSENAPRFNVTFYIGPPVNNHVIDSVLCQDLGGGMRNNISVSWTPSNEGDVTIYAVVDSGDEVTELNEDDNEGNISVYVKARPPRPDLSIVSDDISFSPETPNQGQEVNITAVVRNLGDGNAESALITFYDGTHSIGSSNISLSAGASMEVSERWRAKGGFHTIQVVIEGVDPEDENKSNNRANRTIAVNRLPIVRIVEPEGGDDLADESFTIEWNASDPDGDSLEISLYYDLNADPEDGKTLMWKGDASEGRYRWDTSGLEEGEYYIHACVDDGRGGSAVDTSDALTVRHGRDRRPSVRIDRPGEGEVVSGMVQIRGTATDSDGDDDVSEVYIKIIEVWYRADGTISWRYLWDTTDVEDGRYRITARVYDRIGLWSETNVSVVVKNEGSDLPPGVEIAFPSEGEEVSGVIEISGRAWDDVELKSVEVGLPTGWFEAEGLENWRAVWDTTTTADGPITITVRCEDSAGQRGWAYVNVTVNNANPENFSPEVSIDVRRSLRAGDILTFTVHILDPDGWGDITSVEIWIERSGEVVMSLPNSSLVWRDGEVWGSFYIPDTWSGAYRLKVRVSDAAGHLVERETTFSVEMEGGGESISIDPAEVLVSLAVGAIAVSLRRVRR